VTDTMFRIQIYESPLGPGREMQLVNDNLSQTNERAGAIKFIQDYIAQHDHHGYNGQQDSWWCRNDGDEVVKTLVIRADDAN
jgi:hypothetical protein